MAGNVSTTRILNYYSKTHAVVDSQISGSFSIRIREVERTIVRSSIDDRENLVKQRTVASSSAGVVFEIPPCFLAGEEICRAYVSEALSKTTMDSWIQQLVLPKICKDAMSNEKKGGFLVEAEVEAVKERSLDNFFDLNDYDSQGRRIPTEPDCSICLEDFGQRGTVIMKLRCCDRCFHRDCILPWLGHKPSCPTCWDDIENPRPKKFVPRMILYPEEDVLANNTKGNKDTSAA